MHILKSGDDTEDVPDSYVIFITGNDVMKGNQPIYPVERYVTMGENKAKRTAVHLIKLGKMTIEEIAEENYPLI